jgi:Fur family transcriptional regulator, ferric uptake regulator
MGTQRRNTAQRTVLVDVLDRSTEFQSAQALHASLRSEGSAIGLATVYRRLQEMAGSGELDSIRNESGELLYRRCYQPRHHHHLVCRSCGVTRELDAPEVERWASAVASDHGFIDIEHRIELFGLCRVCAGRQDAEVSASG